MGKFHSAALQANFSLVEKTDPARVHSDGNSDMCHILLDVFQCI